MSPFLSFNEYMMQEVVVFGIPVAWCRTVGKPLPGQIMIQFTVVYTFIGSLQNEIWNLPDRSTFLPKFIYGKGKLDGLTPVLPVRVSDLSLILKTVLVIYTCTPGLKELRNRCANVYCSLDGDMSEWPLTLLHFRSLMELWAHGRTYDELKCRIRELPAAFKVSLVGTELISERMLEYCWFEP